MLISHAYDKRIKSNWIAVMFNASAWQTIMFSTMQITWTLFELIEKPNIKPTNFSHSHTHTPKNTSNSCTTHWFCIRPVWCRKFICFMIDLCDVRVMRCSVLVWTKILVNNLIYGCTAFFNDWLYVDVKCNWFSNSHRIVDF